MTSPRYTALVTVNDRGLIVGGPPIARRWIGEPLSLLLQKWDATEAKRIT